MVLLVARGLTCGCVLCTVLLVPVLVWVWGLKHKIGFGSVFVVDATGLTGCLGRGTGSLTGKELFFRVFALGNSAVESPVSSWRVCYRTRQRR